MNFHRLTFIALAATSQLTAHAEIRHCPQLIEYRSNNTQIFMTKDVLVPKFNAYSLSYRMNHKFLDAGLFPFDKAEDACKEVTRACGNGLVFSVPSNSDWKEFLAKDLFSELDHPEHSFQGRGYWTSNKTWGWSVVSNFPTYTRKHDLITFRDQSVATLDDGSFMAVKCIGGK